MMLHTKYQDSRPNGFRQEYFSCFSYISLCKACGPRAGPLSAPDHNLYKLGRVLLGDVTCQISRLYSMPCGLRQDDFRRFPDISQ